MSTVKALSADDMSPREIICEQRDGETIRIGTAYPKRDGSLSVFLDAFPANGRMIIKTRNNQ